MAKGDQRRREEDRAEEEAVDPKAEKVKEETESEDTQADGQDYDAGVDDAVDETETAPDPLEEPTKPVTVADAPPLPEMPYDDGPVASGDGGVVVDNKGEGVQAGGEVDQGSTDDSTSITTGDENAYDNLNIEDSHNSVAVGGDASGVPDIEPDRPLSDEVVTVGDPVIDNKGPGGSGNGPSGDDTPEPPDGPGNVFIPEGFGEGNAGPEIADSGGGSGLPAASFGAGAADIAPAHSAPEADETVVPEVAPAAPVAAYEEVPVVEEAPVVVDLVEADAAAPVDELDDSELLLD